MRNFGKVDGEGGEVGKNEKGHFIEKSGHKSRTIFIKNIRKHSHESRLIFRFMAKKKTFLWGIQRKSTIRAASS